METGSTYDEFKILSIDGGGIKGLFSACVLHEIERANGRLTDHFDMLCGTSTGGLIALGLAAGKLAGEIVQFYKEWGSTIFPRAGWFHRRRRAAGFFVGGGKYSDANLKRAVNEILGTLRVRDANSYLCIPTVNLTTASPWLFKTDHDGELTRDSDILLSDIALATSAAPFYFPVAVSQDIPGGQYVDGGLWANNPAFVGLIEACRYFAGPGKRYRRVRILSVPGLSAPAGRAAGGRRHLSVLNSAQEIATVALEVQQKCTENFIKLISPSLHVPVNHIRIPMPTLTPEQSQHVALDRADPRAIETLLHLGHITGHAWNTKPDVTAFFQQPAPRPHFRTHAKELH